MTVRNSLLLSAIFSVSALAVLTAAAPAPQQAPVSLIDILKTPAPEPPPQQQAPPPSSQLPADFKADLNVEVEVVNMAVTVTDNKGKFLAGLTKEDFVVLEDGKEREIVNFRATTNSKETALPVGLGLILDLSISLSEEEWGITRTAAEMIVKKYLNKGDELYAIGFHRAPMLIHGVSTDHKVVTDAVRRAKRDTGTAVYDAIAMALQESTKAKHKKQVLVILTDGEDTSSKYQVGQVAALAQRSEVVLYALVVAGDERVGGRSDLATVRRAASELQRITDASGGRTMVIEGFSQLEDGFTNVGKDFTAQYQIAFERGAESDGKYHNVRVGVRRKDVAVRHRLGYVAD